MSEYCCGDLAQGWTLGWRTLVVTHRKFSSGDDGLLSACGEGIFRHTPMLSGSFVETILRLNIYQNINLPRCRTMNLPTIISAPSGSGGFWPSSSYVSDNFSAFWK